MKIAIIGYGKMGKAVERVATERGHEVVARIDADNLDEIDVLDPTQVDVAIEFTAPGSAVDNYRRLMARGIPTVSGTTGWNDHREEVHRLVESTPGAALLWTSNFSLGVNIFFELNRRLARIMAHCPQYTPSVREIHHVHKLDHPSGTAITIADDINANDGREPITREQIEWERVGETPGTHRVTWTSAVDRLVIEHEALSREALALGAVTAAEWLPGHTGLLGLEGLMATLIGD